MEQEQEPVNPLAQGRKCQGCGAYTDERFKDPKSDKWLCYKCDRAFKANVYGNDFFKQSAMLMLAFMAFLSCAWMR